MHKVDFVIPNLAAQFFLLSAFVFCSSTCKAEVIAFKLDANPSFKTQANIQPGKFSEVCGKLKKGNLIRWQFDSSAPLEFNIHYHDRTSKADAQSALASN